MGREPALPRLGRGREYLLAASSQMPCVAVSVDFDCHEIIVSVSDTKSYCSGYFASMQIFQLKWLSYDIHCKLFFKCNNNLV